MMRNLLLLVLLFPLAGCYTTAVALVDTDFGFERVRDGRAAHLESMRARVLESRVENGATIHRFTLTLHLMNDSDQPWTVSRGDWTVQTRPCAGTNCPPNLQVRLAGTADPLMSLAPRSATSVSVPLEIVVPPELTLRRLEPHPIRLVLESGGQPVLEKRLSIGVYDQLGQAGRVFLVVTLGLLAFSFV